MGDPLSSKGEGCCVRKIGSLRKRPLEATTVHSFRRADCEDKKSGVIPEHTCGVNTVLEEIELHFQRSLSQPKTKRITLADIDTSFEKPDAELQISDRSSENKLSSSRTGVPPLLPVRTDCTDLMSDNGEHDFSKDIHQQTSSSVGSMMSENEATTEAMINCSVSTGCKIASTTLSGPIQVIDITNSGIKTNRDSLQASKDNTNCSHNDFSPTVVTGNSSTTPLQAGTSPVFLMPVPPGGSGSTVMIQPQPYILVNPTEFHKINATPLVNNTPNTFCGTSNSGFVLLSPSTFQSKSLHFITAPGITGSHTGLISSNQVHSPQQYIKSSPGSTRKEDININVKPASVEDHFAKALGEQWSELNSGSILSQSHSTVKS